MKILTLIIPVLVTLCLCACNNSAASHPSLTTTQESLTPGDAAIRAVADPAVMSKYGIADFSTYEISVVDLDEGEYRVDYWYLLHGYPTGCRYTAVVSAEGTVEHTWDDVEEFAEYFPYVTSEAMAHAVTSIENQAEDDLDHSDYYLKIDSEGYLCLSTEIIVELDPPPANEDGLIMDGCGFDHEHLFFSERICRIP